MAENIFASACRPFKPKNGRQSYQTLRNVWMRSKDRDTCLNVALKLVDAGFTPTSYGLGCIRVAVFPNAVRDLCRLAFKLGLTVPFSVTSDPNLEPEVPDIALWGGEPYAQMEAILHYTGRRDSLLQLDGLLDLPDEQARPRALEIIEAMKTLIGKTQQ
jgi:hypothetical protein